MPLALVLSSHVAGSRVGGGVSVSTLQARGVDAAFCPTVLFGRHPGWGAPGGAAVGDDMFAGQLEGVAAHGLYQLTDAVLTGYFASAAQVEIAAQAIDDVRAAHPREREGSKAFLSAPLVMVDPILGDEPHGLYVKPEVAAAVKTLLVPRADILAPNAFELGWLSGRSVTDAGSALAAARALGRPVLASSIPCGDEIGVLYADADSAWLVRHARFEGVPNGTGDFLAAAFLAVRIYGEAPRAALESAASAVAETARKAVEWGSFELPDISARAALTAPQTRLKAGAFPPR